jgi:hypothetical protein
LRFAPFDPDLARLIATLPQASSIDLYRIEYAVQRLRSEPQRILSIRSRLHLGMTVAFFSVHDGTMHTGRIVALRSRDATIDDTQQNMRYRGVPYAALDLGAKGGSPNAEIVEQAKPRPAPKRLTRADFNIGDIVSFADRDEQIRIGKIVRLNAKTATIECDNGNWRVAFALLQHVVDV